MKRKDQSSFAVWITGLPASGKSTLARELVRQLHDLGIDATVLESDMLRSKVSKQPRYDEQDREYFYASLAFIGRTLTEYGIPVIFDATANRRTYRAQARQGIRRFIEVYVECPLDICIQRDPKGIYRSAQDGTAFNVPGLQAVYEPPENPDVIIRGDRGDPIDAARRVIELLSEKGFLKEEYREVS